MAARWWFSFVCLVACTVGRSETVPEQPDWSQPSSPPAAQLTDDPQPDKPSSKPSASETSAVNGAPSHFATEGGNAVPAAIMDAMENEAPVEADAAAEVGVPEPSNFFLPKLSDYGQPFFERQGLHFRIGPVHLNLSLSLTTEYNTNIYATHTDEVAGLVEHISPYIQVGMGDFRTQAEDFLLLNYHPSYDYYSGNSNANYLSQSLEFTGRMTYSRYTTAAILSYINSNTPTATQSQRQSYQIVNFNWDNSYYVGGKTFARLTIGAVDQNYENNDNYETYTVSPVLGYDFSPKTTITFGPYAGIAYINGSSNTSVAGTQTFQGFSIGLNYVYSPKLTFNGVAGVQARQFHGENSAGASNFTTPVFDFTFTYTPREKTDITLELIRNVQISDILQGLTYTDSEVQFGLVHRLTTKITLNLAFDYQYLQYQGSSPQGRTDEYVSFNPSVSYSFWHDQCLFNLYYHRQQRTSTVSEFGYSIDTYGLQFIFQF